MSSDRAHQTTFVAISASGGVPACLADDASREARLLAGVGPREAAEHVEEPYVWHVPALTGGAGGEAAEQAERLRALSSR